MHSECPEVELSYRKIWENRGKTLGMVPFMINPVYTLYSGYLLGTSPFKGFLGGLNSSGTIM